MTALTIIAAIVIIGVVGYLVSKVTCDDKNSCTKEQPKPVKETGCCDKVKEVEKKEQPAKVTQCSSTTQKPTTKAVKQPAKKVVKKKPATTTKKATKTTKTSKTTKSKK